MGLSEKLSVGRMDYKGWDAWWLRHGPLQLVLVPQVGGRIMSIQWRDHELSFVNPDCEGRVQDVTAISDVRECKRRLGFLLWGGDKTWIAPQSRWTDDVPFIDLDAGSYALSIDEAAGTATMLSPICRETGVQIERVIRFGETAGNWTVSHCLCNRSTADVTWAPWDVTMLNRPATVYLPTRSDSAFPMGLQTFDNEGVSATVRDRVVKFLDGMAAIECRDPIKFKYGVDAQIGSILAVIETAEAGLIGYRKSVPSFNPLPYASGCIAELFNAELHPYFELELHGPITTLRPEAQIVLQESAALFDIAGQPEPSTIRRHLGH